MRKFYKYAFVVLLLSLLVSAPFSAAAGSLTVYTSMKEALMGTLKEGFLKAHPDVELDYYIAGAGKIMSKIASERAAGGVLADVLWHSETPDFFDLKREGLLEPYVSPEARHAESLFSDPDGCFTPARNGTLAIAYNTDRIKIPPSSWKDLLEPYYKDAFGIADPSLSGTAFGSVAALVQTFGWEFFEGCRANGAHAGQGSGQVVEDTAQGELAACIAVDYIVADKIRRGAPLGFVFPPEVIMLPSPVAIMKDSKNIEDARKFVDFLLSKEGQAIIAESGSLPVRSDVPLPKDTLLPKPHDAVQRAIRLDFEKLVESKEETLQRFMKLLRP